MKYTRIKSDEQYNLYAEIHEKLTYKNYESNKDEIELIEVLIDDYEKRTIDAPPELDPVQIIDYLLKENNISKSQLAKELKVSRQLITDIMNYRRNISKSMILKLSNRFKMNQSAFSRTYKLKRIKAIKQKEIA